MPQRFHHGFGHRIPGNNVPLTLRTQCYSKRNLGSVSNRSVLLYRRLRVLSCVLTCGLFSIFLLAYHHIHCLPIFSGQFYTLDVGGGQIMSMDDWFCSEFTLKVKYGQSVPAILSLPRPPTLDIYTNTSFSTKIIPEGYTSWSRFLHGGSVVSVTVSCDEVLDVKPVVFFIRGKENYVSWLGHGTLEHVYQSDAFLDRCQKNQTFMLSTPVGIDDRWYVVVQGQNSHISYPSNLINAKGYLSINIGVREKVYSVKETEIVNSCHVYWTTQCSIPTSPGATYLLTAVRSPEAMYNRPTTVVVYCNMHKWAYVLFAAPVMFPLLLALALLVGMCYYRRKVEKLARRVVTVSGDGLDKSQPHTRLSCYQGAPPPYTPISSLDAEFSVSGLLPKSGRPK